MDVPEPPKIVLEAPAPCADARAAEELLTKTLLPSLAPRGEWEVRVRVRKDAKGLTAEGELTDENGAPVAHREITQETRECSALARAMGVWASLVLDEEVERAAQKEPAVEPSAVPWPAPAPPEKPAPDQALFLKNPEEKRDVEIGMGASYTYGTLSDVGPAIVGGHLYAVLEIDDGWFLRPQASLGRALTSTSATTLTATWAALRMDACRRMPGNYLEHRGIQMDVCGGLEAGFASLDGGGMALSNEYLGLLAPTGTIALRGELGSELSVEVRGLVGVNLSRQTIFDNDQPLLVFARSEIGFTWRLR